MRQKIKNMCAGKAAIGNTIDRLEGKQLIKKDRKPCQFFAKSHKGTKKKDNSVKHGTSRFVILFVIK